MVSRNFLLKSRHDSNSFVRSLCPRVEEFCSSLLDSMCLLGLPCRTFAEGNFCGLVTERLASMRVMVLIIWLKLLSNLGILYNPLEPPTDFVLSTLSGSTEGAGTRDVFLEISWSRSRVLPVSLARYSLLECPGVDVFVTA